MGIGWLIRGSDGKTAGIPASADICCKFFLAIVWQQKRFTDKRQW